jgi:hypothetical protein
VDVKSTIDWDQAYTSIPAPSTISAILRRNVLIDLNHTFQQSCGIALNTPFPTCSDRRTLKGLSKHLRSSATSLMITLVLHWLLRRVTVSVTKSCENALNSSFAITDSLSDRSWITEHSRPNDLARKIQQFGELYFKSKQNRCVFCSLPVTLRPTIDDNIW